MMQQARHAYMHSPSSACSPALRTSTHLGLLATEVGKHGIYQRVQQWRQQPPLIPLQPK